MANNFVKIKCPDCQNTQVTFSKPATTVVCNVCGATLVRPTGGKGDFKMDKADIEELN